MGGWGLCGSGVRCVRGTSGTCSVRGTCGTRLFTIIRNMQVSGAVLSAKKPNCTARSFAGQSGSKNSSHISGSKKLSRTVV